MAASRIAELCFFCIFSPARQAALLKFWALVALFSGPEGLAAKRRSPYLDNIETIGGMKNPCFWLCHAENWDFACIVFGGDYLKNGQKKAASSGGSSSAARIVPTCEVATTDYTVILQSVQDEVSGRFAPKKALGMELSRVYELLSLYRRADRVAQCGSEIEFGILQDGSKKLVKANFCRDRLCPMCNWRRSLKLYSQVSQVMDVLESRGYCFLFLTLTLRNCPWDELPVAIQAFLSGWRNLYHEAPVFRRSVHGTSRALEITVNHGARTYHPHLHVVLAVKPSYFTSRDYISQAQWTQLWRSCCDISYDPIVNIKRIKETSQGFKEISKYAVKGSDFLVGSSELMQCHVSNFLAGLSGRRLVGSTGVFKHVQRELCLDDPETGDLVVTDGQQLRDDVYCMMVRYGWCSGVYVRR